MIKIITAMNNTKINDELKNEKNIELICKDIFYKEGILEILENEININYIIINSELPGEIKLNNLIEKILEKNEKIKIIILIKKENKNNFYKIKNDKKDIKNDNIEIIKDIKNKNIIRIFYKNEIKIEQLKKYNQIKNNNENNKEPNNKKIKNKTIIFFGERQVGKSIIILGITKSIEKNNKKILLIELNKKESDLLLILSKNKNNKKNLIIKKQKIKKYKKTHKKYLNKNKIKIIQNLIVKINKNIDIISYKKKINFNIIKKLEKKYEYIFIEINSEKNSKKIINNINKKILIIRPNILGIKNAKKIIEKNKINKYKIIINNYNKYSINTEIIEKIFKEKIIGKIKYNQEYDKIINNNFKISKENVKNLIKEFQVLNI